MAVAAATQLAGHAGADMSAARACPARVGLTVAVDRTIKALLTKS